MNVKQLRGQHKKEGAAAKLGAQGRNAKAARSTGKPKAMASAPRKPRGRHSSTSEPFPVVGIGASAGGLEAVTNLLKHLPTDTGMAFVLVQHLDPTHPSALTEILSRATAMRVTEVKDGMRVEPNHVYVIPPNTNMAILHHLLSLMPRTEKQGLHLPIDYFLRSLAEDRRGRAVGVILSGTASDGTLGLKAIKAEGGITFAQDEQSAKYDGMPRSAIMSGFVDCVLPPEGIARELTRLSRHPYVMLSREAQATEWASGETDILNKIFILLRTHTGVDFTDYKHTTIRRRIQRRMLLHKIERMDQYVQFLQQHADEVEALYQDLLINVTGFFRDPDSFRALTEKMFPRLLKNRGPDQSIRVWVPGCSTGEEAYSIAIIMLESIGDKRAEIPVQIFATDISDRGHREGAGRGLSQEHRAGSVRRTVATFLREVGPGLSDQEGGPRNVRVRPAKRGQRSAVLQAGSHQLSQRDDLSGTRVAEEAAADFPLRPQTRWSAHAGFLGNHRRHFPICLFSRTRRRRFTRRSQAATRRCLRRPRPSARANNGKGATRLCGVARSYPSYPASTRKRTA